MSTTELVVMVLLFAVALARYITLRHCAVATHPRDTLFFITLWLSATCVALFPFVGHMLIESIPVIKAQPWLMAIGMVKGVFLYMMIMGRQVITKTSASSAAYMGFLTLGVLALANSMLGEEMSVLQYTSIGLLSLLGLVFVCQGHLSEQPRAVVALFAVIAVLSALPGMCDQSVIPSTNWYTQLCLCAVGQLVASVVHKRPTWQDMRFVFRPGGAMLAGAVFGASEVVILGSMITYLPVTMTVMAISLSIPAMMVLSAVYWGEGNVWRQSVFGVLGYLAVIPLVL